MKKKQMQDVQIYTDMIYCPECGAIQSKKENFCSQCGTDLHKGSKKELIEQKKEEKEIDTPLMEEAKAGEKDVPFYKNKVFIFFASFFVLTSIIAGSILALKMNESNKFKNDVLSIWGEIKKESTDINSKVASLDNYEDFPSVALEIKDSENVISENKDKLNKIESPNYYEEGKEEMVKSVDAFINYLQELRAQADNPSDMTDQDIVDVERLASEAKNKMTSAYAKLNFIEDRIPDEVYSAVLKFETVRDEYEKQLAGEEQQKAETERQTQEQQEAKARAEATVTSFMNAYIAGNQSEVKKYMTAAFQKEFNYADLSADARLYSYPESFRVTTNKKMSENQYDIYGRELQVNRDSGSKWTINRHFAVLYSASDNKWLIDRWDISSE
jgi:hypothetical protein